MLRTETQAVTHHKKTEQHETIIRGQLRSQKKSRWHKVIVEQAQPITVAVMLTSR